jgi:hypothetical protein
MRSNAVAELIASAHAQVSDSTKGHCGLVVL